MKLNIIIAILKYLRENAFAEFSFYIFLMSNGQMRILAFISIAQIGSVHQLYRKYCSYLQLDFRRKQLTEVNCS